MVELLSLSEISSVRIVVLIMIFSGLFLTKGRMRLTSGLNSSALIIILKYRMVNISITLVGVIFLMSLSIILLMSVLKLFNNVNMIGIVIRVTSGDNRLLMIRYMKVIIISKLSVISMWANFLRCIVGGEFGLSVM